MAEIQMTRIDARLIHGQVITKWIRQTSANRIVIVNDVLASDDFMKDIYEMAAPPGVEVNIYSVDTAVSYWNKYKLGEGKLFVLFKDVETIFNTIKNGLFIKNIQIGGLGSGNDKKFVYGPIGFNESEIDMLKELKQLGCYIYLHQVPEEAKMDFDKALERYKQLKK